MLRHFLIDPNMLRTLDAAVAAGHGVNVSGRRLFVANRCCVWSVGYCMIQCSLRFQCQLFGCKINIVLLPGAYRSVQISVPFLRAFPDKNPCRSPPAKNVDRRSFFSRKRGVQLGFTPAFPFASWASPGYVIAASLRRASTHVFSSAGIFSMNFLFASLSQ